MKRWLICLLAVLLFAGCAAEETQETSENTVTEPSGIYIPESEIEKQTDGAIRAYKLEGADYIWLAPCGSNVLLADKNLSFTVLTGENAIPAWSTKVEGAAGFYFGSRGFGYYKASANEFVLHSTLLQQFSQVPVPEGIQGVPLLDDRTGEIYYSANGELRALDPGQSISRLLRKHNYQSLSLKYAEFGGAVLVCEAEEPDGKKTTLYISSETGQTLAAGERLKKLYTSADTFYAVYQEGTVVQNIYGTSAGVSGTFPAENNVMPALELGGVVTQITDENNALTLVWFDLASGRKTAQITLPSAGALLSALGDPNTGCVWLLTGSETEQILYRWELAKSPIADETVYTGVFYSAAAPDADGLAACKARVSALNSKHGIDIRIWQDALKTAGGYKLEAEHQTAAINRCLDELEPVLDLFPYNFLYKGVAKRVRISIVRSVDDAVQGAFFWNGSDPYIVLSVGADVRDTFMNAMGYIVDSHVLGNSSLVDLWANLNPSDFAYGTDRSYDEYLTGVYMAFLDEQSMKSVVEDRSRVFYFAMKENSGQLFQSQTMQAKLLQLCKGIRQAWRLERKAETYPWEQYLHQSLAYTE